MLCPNCQVEFNSTTNIPRILIFCGHTYCHACIETLLAQNQDSQNEQSQLPKNSLNCPECGTLNQGADGVNSFPKNLVLLQVNTQQVVQGTAQLQKQQSVKETKPRDTQQKTQQEQSKALCNIHQKKLEAFCEKDLQVLCIDCILSEQHKSHEIISVQKAAEKQKQCLYDEVTNATKTEERLRFIQSDIKRHINEMHSQAEKNRKELSQIYSYVRDLILEREQALKRQISENLVREEQESDAKLQEINDFMNSITQLKQELLSQNTESEIEVLQKAKQRSLISHDVNGLKSKELMAFNINNVIQVSQSLTEIKRDSELMQISKIVNPSYKGPSIGQGFGQQSSLYQHTQSTVNKMKKANTQGSGQMSANIASGQNQVSSQGQLIANLEKNTRDDVRKSTKMNNQVKTKVSPHRPNKKQEAPSISSKKQGVVVLDQNKQKYHQGASNQKYGKNQGSFNAVPNINLYNYNQFNPNLQSSQNNINIGQSDENSEDVIGTMGGDDMSSIYPLETNDCFFQFQENAPAFKNAIKRDESVGALNDLLESLNKSGGAQEHQAETDVKGSSTASETGGSHSDIKTPPPQDFKVKNIKSNIETPKSKKMNPWKASGPTTQTQKSKSNKKSLKKDNSTTDLDDMKSKKLITKNTENSYYQGYEERKQEQRPGSLNRYSSNGLLIKEVESDHKMKEALINNQLSSLSQERTKRKQQKMNGPSIEQSPFKLDKVNNGPFSDRQQIMDILHECTKNIEKLELKPKGKAQQLNRQESNQCDSPIKLQSVNSSKAAVCVVDLTKKEEFEDMPLRLNQEERDQIHENEEEEGDQMKKIPNATNQKDPSPFRNKKDIFKPVQQINVSSYQSSPQKSSVMRSSESLDNLMQQTSKHSDTSLEHSKIPANFANDNLFQNSVSVDTSVSDPFRALCRVKEEFIFVFSGFNDQKLLTCEALDIQRGTWKEICQIGKARTKFSAVPISKSRILIFGGKQSDGQRTGEIEEYNLKTNKFKTLPFKLPKPRSGFAACVKREEGKIFFCGGNSGSVLKKFDCLDLKKGKWSRWPEMIQKRDELAVALGPDGKIYAIGGYGGGSSSSSQATQDNGSTQDQSSSKNASSNCLRTAERFDFATGQWEMLPEMNEARRALAAVALPDGIYAIGGYDGKQYLSTVEKFDLQKQQWVQMKSMNTSRCTLSAVVSSDCQYIYALGGFNGNSLDLVERYNTMTDEWEFVTPMVSKRFMHEAVCLITH